MTEKQDVYTRVTRKIIADLERGSLTWLQPWQAGHQAGPVSRPCAPAAHLSRRECADAVGVGDGKRLQQSPLAATDRPTVGRPGPQRRKRHPRRLRRHLHPHRNRRERRGQCGRDSLHEGVYGVQCRPGGQPARPLLRHSPARFPGYGPAGGRGASLRRPAREYATAEPWPSTVPPMTWCRCRSFMLSATRKAITPPSPMR